MKCNDCYMKKHSYDLSFDLSTQNNFHLMHTCKHSSLPHFVEAIEICIHTKNGVTKGLVNYCTSKDFLYVNNHYCNYIIHFRSKREVYSLLPIAICLPTSFNHELIPPTHQTVCTRLPLVSEDIWRYLIEKYPYNEVKIVVKKRPSVDLLPRCGT